jgi:hypothetical protein
MKIYLASSWKNKEYVMLIRDYLKSFGHSVDCFCDPSNGRISFNWSEIPDITTSLTDLDARDMMKHPMVIDAFNEDKKMIEWSDICILILPSGNSSHLEAGYAKGLGKYLYIFGIFEKCSFDTMYGFADGLFDDINKLAEAIKNLQ